MEPDGRRQSPAAGGGGRGLGALGSQEIHPPPGRSAAAAPDHFRGAGEWAGPAGNNFLPAGGGQGRGGVGSRGRRTMAGRARGAGARPRRAEGRGPAFRAAPPRPSAPGQVKSPPGGLGGAAGLAEVPGSRRRRRDVPVPRLGTRRGSGEGGSAGPPSCLGAAPRPAAARGSGAGDVAPGGPALLATSRPTAGPRGRASAAVWGPLLRRLEPPTARPVRCPVRPREPPAPSCDSVAHVGSGSPKAWALLNPSAGSEEVLRHLRAAAESFNIYLFPVLAPPHPPMELNSVLNTVHARDALCNGSMAYGGKNGWR